MVKYLVGALLLLSSHCMAQYSAKPNHLDFAHFDERVFAKASEQNKPVLLHLRANWCHWCHVMEKETYTDKNIQNTLKKSYLYTMEDHDERADLTALYGQYGWPATLIFSTKGKLLFAEAGYISKDELLEILTKYENYQELDDQNQGKELLFLIENKNKSQIAQKIEIIESQMLATLDVEIGGFNSEHKFLDLATIYYAINHFEGRPHLEEWLHHSVQNSFAINDKEWGGVYQYSTHRDWQHAHYEKLLSFQADYIQLYVAYAEKFDSKKALQNAENIASYVKRFLTKKDRGGYYSAQDADLVQGKKADDYFSLSNAQRMALGIPAIDSNVYTNSSMQYSVALQALYKATNNTLYLSEAKNSIVQLYQERFKEGLMQHGRYASNIKNLSDQLYTIQALWFLAANTQNDNFKAQANTLLKNTIRAFFDSKTNSMLAFVGKTALSNTYHPAENMLFANLLKTGFDQKMIAKSDYEILYMQIMDFLTNKYIMQSYNSEAGVLNSWL